MHSPTVRFDGDSLGFAEELYQRFLADPAAVEPSWRRYFETLETVPQAPPAPALAPAPPSAEALSERLPFLTGLRLFRGLPAAEVAELAKLASELTKVDGEFVFRQNEPGDALYVVLEGNVVIWRDGELVVDLGVGEVVGELAVLDQSPRIADAIARGAVRLLRLRAEDLLSRLDHQPALARGLLRGLTHRLRGRSTQQHRVDQLVRAYRSRGHLAADLNPLGPQGHEVPELELGHWGLADADLDTLFASPFAIGSPMLRLREIVERLRESYCGAIGVQYMHLDSLERKDWLRSRLEQPAARRRLSVEEQRRILTKLTDAEIFEQFIHKKFLGAKRFSAEGAETLIPLLDQVVDEAAEQGLREIVIGMAHRGRLNVLANVLDKSPAQIFREFEDQDGESLRGRGDVKYHLGSSTDRVYANGHRVHLSLCFNPSHLEFVGPVAMGRVRAKQDQVGDTRRQQAMALVIHGDAAFAGQGVVQEMLNMSGLAGYTTGGSLHLIVNNQIGFTTPPESGRSSVFAADVAKLLQSPIFHVNGEHPEAVAQVIRVAMEYRKEFASDVIIDMYCYRRYGHNEGDEPAFTQPLMYEQIRRRKSVREGYLDSLLPLGGITNEDAETIAEERRQKLEAELARARDPGYRPLVPSLAGRWAPYRGGRDAAVPEVATAVPAARLAELLAAQGRVPAGFSAHPKLVKGLFDARLEMAEGRRSLDWGAGEALAFASLLAQGHGVRLTGQDCGRGTFSHRHAVLRDVATGAEHVPLANLAADQAPFQVWDSPLSEVGPMAFEYGFGLDAPDWLVVWEAQFGDFFNVAQVIVDQFVSSGEDKWNRLSALCLLLPHGFEGQGPEHSSARLERFLALAAEDNMQVVNLTTPAQLFHCLRRQVLRPLRKPLIVMSPKSLLRHAQAVSPLADFAQGSFERVIPDRETAEPARVRRVLITSGKIYYELAAKRAELGRTDVAIVRLEQYYPLALEALAAALAPYAPGTPLLWVQEEPWNMGARSFLGDHLGHDHIREWPLAFLARPASSSPATGSLSAHKQEQAEILSRAFTFED